MWFMKGGSFELLVGGGRPQYIYIYYNTYVIIFIIHVYNTLYCKYIIISIHMLFHGTPKDPACPWFAGSIGDDHDHAAVGTGYLEAACRALFSPSKNGMA